MRIIYPAFAAILLFCLTPILEAKIIKFPESDPAFEFKLPGDWTMEDKGGDLVCKSGEHIGVTLNVNRMGENFEKVKQALPDLGKIFTNSAKMSEIETKDKGDATNKNKVKGTIYVVKGKSSGRLLTAELIAIEPKKGADAYLIMFSGLAEVLEKRSEDLGIIIDSITPIDKQQGKGRKE